MSNGVLVRRGTGKGGKVVQVVGGWEAENRKWVGLIWRGRLIHDVSRQAESPCQERKDYAHCLFNTTVVKKQAR
jgi:hypothetical protein